MVSREETLISKFVGRCDCAFPATSNIIWFQDTSSFDIVNFVVLDFCIQDGAWKYKSVFQKKCLWIPWVSAGGFWGEMAADSGKMDSTESQFNNTFTSPITITITPWDFKFVCGVWIFSRGFWAKRLLVTRGKMDSTESQINNTAQPSIISTKRSSSPTGTTLFSWANWI